MTPHQAACAAARAAQELADGHDTSPVLQWVTPHGVLTCCGADLDTSLRLADSWAAAISTSITLVADSWHATVAFDPTDAKAREAADAIRRGDLAARWQAGDPTITEAVVVVTCHRTAAAEMTVQPYDRAGGGIVWGAPLHTDGADVEELQGRVMDALRSALDAWQYTDPGEAAAHAVLETQALLLAEAGGLGAEVTPL